MNPPEDCTGAVAIDGSSPPRNLDSEEVCIGELTLRVHSSITTIYFPITSGERQISFHRRFSSLIFFPLDP